MSLTSWRGCSRGAPVEVADELAERVERAVHMDCSLVNIGGALVVGAYTLLFPSGGGAHGPLWRAVLVSWLLMAVYLGATIGLGHHLGLKMAARAARLKDPEVSADDRRDVLRTPMRLARMSFGFWTGAAVLFVILNLFLDPSGQQSLRVGLAILLGGLTTSSLVYLRVERAMRPAFAALFADGLEPTGSGLGLRWRLLVFWALGSGLPLLGLALSPFGVRDRSSMVAPTVGLAVLGLLVGGLLVTVASRAVTDPVRSLREAVERLGSGDLDVAVPVDNGGELGLLQSGFNRMAAGLRERRLLVELFGRQVGPEVARRALERGVGLGGERCEASVLFVDLIGSSRLPLTRSPEAVVHALNNFFGVVVRVVTAEGGWVNKFEGDGALCVFGPPDGLADHPSRALRAARTLRRELLALSASDPGLDAAIGVSAGTVIAGNVGSEERFEYTVIGVAVNEAARLSEASKERLGRVLAGQNVVEAAGTAGNAECSRWMVAEEMVLRGTSEPVLAFSPRPDPELLEVGGLSGP